MAPPSPSRERPSLNTRELVTCRPRGKAVEQPFGDRDYSTELIGLGRTEEETERYAEQLNAKVVRLAVRSVREQWDLRSGGRQRNNSCSTAGQSSCSSHVRLRWMRAV